MALSKKADPKGFEEKPRLELSSFFLYVRIRMVAATAAVLDVDSG